MPKNSTGIDGWNSYAPIFAELIDEIKPRVIIEVGSWQGASAIHMAKLAPGARIKCVDTFQGSREHQSMELPRDERGASRLLELFRANVGASGVGDRIDEYAMTSAEAAEAFSSVQDVLGQPVACMVYIDGSHEYEDVKADLAAYWPLLRPGGIMFGDDWLEWHNTVARAVREFGSHEVRGNHWLMRKPLS